MTQQHKNTLLELHMHRIWRATEEANAARREAWREQIEDAKHLKKLEPLKNWRSDDARN